MNYLFRFNQLPANNRSTLGHYWSPLLHLEEQCAARTFSTQDRKEGWPAVLAKRTRHFTGR